MKRRVIFYLTAALVTLVLRSDIPLFKVQIAICWQNCAIAQQQTEVK